MKKSKVSFGVLLTLVAILPMVALSLLSLGVSVFKLSGALESANETSVSSVAYSLMESLDLMYAGDWSYDENGILKKGDNNVTELQPLLDGIKSEKGYDVTLFYGDTRVLTTLKNESGAYIIGTTADPKVTETVLKNKQSYFNENLIVNGVESYVCYEPLLNENGTAAGMVFVGYPRAEGQKHISSTVLSMVISNFAFLILVIIVIIVLVRMIVGTIKRLSLAVNKLSEGDLNITVPVDALVKHNEIGMLAYDIEGLAAKLQNIVEGIKSNANTLDSNSEELYKVVETTEMALRQVSIAIDEVATGSSSQARDTSQAIENIDQLNVTLDMVADSITELATKSEEATETSNQAKQTMSELIGINTKTKEHIDNIVTQSEKNVQAANKINSILTTIEEISTQTNLLSLNANIEAARAGEQGRGFAVVASEIGGLADSSGAAAKEIREIISNLVSDIQETSELSEILNQTALQQIEKLRATASMFDVVLENVHTVSKSADSIRKDIENINAAKESISLTIESLAGISEENAAASKQTTTSANIVSEDMQKISGVSSEVRSLSEKLKDLIGYFR